LNDCVCLSLRQFGEHRQREELRGAALCNWESSSPITKDAASFLQMDGDRVVDGTSYIFFGQAPRDFISILDANRVDMIDMADAGCMSRQNYFRNPIQSPIVVGGVRTTELITFFEVFEFHPQN